MFRRVCSLFLFLVMAEIACSQCTKSSGTPIINETFGSGVNPIGPPLPPGITNLQFVNNACPNDGMYSIVNYTSGCYGAWHTLTDHTGDKNGYFMLINASYQPSDFFLQTVNGLCDGTTYRFSAYIINMFQVSGGIEPNVTFTIEKTDGTVLSTYNTGDILMTQAIQWGNYGFYFTTPVGVSTVVLRMHNNAPGGGGNDLALDDITFTPAGPQTTIGLPGFNSNTATIYCNNKTSIVSQIGTCYVNTVTQWQMSTDQVNWNDLPGETGPSYTINVPGYGTYYYRLNVAQQGNIGSPNCRINSNVFTVNYSPPTQASVSAAICTGTSYTMPSGKMVSAQGTYIDTARTPQGCDSLITHLNLQVKSNSFSTLSTAICDGHAYLGYTKTGTYIDTLTAANGCDSIRTLNLIVKPLAYSTLNAAICSGDSYLGYTKTGTYKDTLTAANGCDSIRTLNLVVNKASPDLGPGRVLCLGDSITLNPGSFISYRWQDGSTTPYFKTKTGGVFWVKVIDGNGCMATDSVTLKEVNCSLANIPNTFSPNGDGINDTWNIYALQGYPGCKVLIYTRYGQLIFSSVNYPIPWDGRYKGKELPVGVYYYIIDLNDGKPPVSGYVTIVR